MKKLLFILSLIPSLCLADNVIWTVTGSTGNDQATRLTPEQSRTTIGAIGEINGFASTGQTVTNSNTLVSSTQATVVLTPGTWNVDAFYDISTTATTSVGSKLNMRFTGSSTQVFNYFGANPSSTTAIGSTPGWNPSSKVLPYSPTSPNGSMVGTINGQIVVVTTGTLEFQFAQNTASPGQSATLNAGSFIRAWK